MKNKIVVIVLGFKDLLNVDDCFCGLVNQDYGNYEIWYADNGSNDGSVSYVNKKYPQVKTFNFKSNHGYACGNNRLVDLAFKKDADFCLLLNADTKSDSKLLTSLMGTYNSNVKNEKVGLIQPIVLINNKNNIINSAGNIIHHLGFGYCGEYLSANNHKEDKQIISVSGVAMFISKKYYNEVGSFDENYFMYNEDQDYSWRGLIYGYKHYLSASGKVWHKYSFSKNKNKMFHSEKNRLMTIFKNYENRTLLKLLPLIIFNEIVVSIYALFNGWFSQKMRGYLYLCRNVRLISRRRKKVQLSRKINDKLVANLFSSQLDFTEMNNIVIKKVINPLYSFYIKKLFNY